MLYKYRSLKDFRYFVDIILNNRLYATMYKDLNDPMEGMYLNPDIEVPDVDTNRIKDAILNNKRKVRICSLSRDPFNELLWAHYADGARGIVIGIETEKDYKAHKVLYKGPYRANINDFNDPYYFPEKLFTHKGNAWSYEKECRIFTDNKFHVPVTVKEITIGRAMSTQDQSFIKKLIKRINNSIVISHQ